MFYLQDEMKGDRQEATLADCVTGLVGGFDEF
jgi:hypothetical protein